MSYAAFLEKSIVLGTFPYSSSLANFEYSPFDRCISIAWKSDPSFYYNHFDCSMEDFIELMKLIDYHWSGRKGYDEWKERRRERFATEDEKNFQELWKGLNEYQRTNLIEFAKGKEPEHWLATKVAIKRRTM